MEAAVWGARVSENNEDVSATVPCDQQPFFTRDTAARDCRAQFHFFPRPHPSNQNHSMRKVINDGAGIIMRFHGGRKPVRTVGTHGRFNPRGCTIRAQVVMSAQLGPPLVSPYAVVGAEQQCGQRVQCAMLPYMHQVLRHVVHPSTL